MGFLDALGGGTGSSGAKAPDLTGWRLHGLEHHGSGNVVGYSFLLKPDWEDARRNVITGCPGETVRSSTTSGRTRGGRRNGDTPRSRSSSPGSASSRGDRGPAAVQSLGQGRGAAGMERLSEQLGLRSRHFYCSPNADIGAIRRTMSGGLAERFDVVDPAVTPNFRFGTSVRERRPPRRGRDRGALRGARRLRGDRPRRRGAWRARGARSMLPAPFFIDQASMPDWQIAPVPPYPQTGDIERGRARSSRRRMARARECLPGRSRAGLVPEDPLVMATVPAVPGSRTGRDHRQREAPGRRSPAAP